MIVGSKSLKHHTAIQALFMAWYNFARKNKAGADACDGQWVKRPRMDDQRTNREGGRSVSRFVTSTPRERILAGVLSLVYIGGWALAGYAYSIRIEDHWPARVFWVVGATWFAIMLVLPLVVACLFFGIDRSPAWIRGRFSLRTLLIAITLVAVGLRVIVSLVK